MKIGPHVINESGDLISDILKSYSVQINEAYQESEEEVSVSLNLKIRPGKEKEFELEASISFVKARVKDIFKRSVDELQMDILTFPRAVEEGVR